MITMELTELAVTDTLRVLLAMLAGGLIGLEREFRDKAAGFRTLIFISSGSAVFTILSHNIGGDEDPARIAANIVTGIGFLGAGAILRDGMRVAGLTTAATIWLTAAIGMAIGGGEFLFGAGITLLALIVLWVFPAFEHAVDRVREERTYEAMLAGGREDAGVIESNLKAAGLKIMLRHHYKKDEALHCQWVTYGKLKNHEKFVQYLLDESKIVDFKY
jgi:putative Mg2+ transporter-C (MgtC) family protein